LIHCDVKPHNLIVTPESQLKIADFGIARALSTIQSSPQPNVVWGSPQYFSPEQAAGQTLTPASDVYSLGVVMYEMLTGRLPFNASTASELSLLHRTATPAPPHQLNPEIYPEIEAIIMKVLSKIPAARYRTADQFGQVLMSVNRPSMFAPTRAAYVPPPSSYQASSRPSSSPLDIDWVTWALTILALIAVGGLIPLWLWVYLLYFPTP
jgi:serine/threonine-protein kinase